jgi:sugar/nucleoside kinase (ribokinase family)
MVVVHTENHAVVVTTEGEVFCQDSVKVPDEEIAGANGAGDAFAAGFLHVLHEGGGVAEALENAVRIAAQSLRDATPSGGVREI